MADRTKHCAACGKPVELEKKAVRRDECTHCGAELHACVNCEHFDADRTRGCREPNALAEETIRDVTRANFCQWFDHRVGPPQKAPTALSSREAFEALFSKDKPPADPSRTAAEDAFSKLFKR